MRFLCDEMLKRLGQWLRAAGYDVVTLPDGTDDRVLIDRAIRENRILLTRDREIGAHPGAQAVAYCLDCNDLDECVSALNDQLPIDWHYRPFTRCMLCNTPLVDANAERRREVPPDARVTGSKVLFCPTCDKVYWDGGHVARMRQRLDVYAKRKGTGRPARRDPTGRAGSN